MRTWLDRHTYLRFELTGKRRVEERTTSWRKEEEERRKIEERRNCEIELD
jgi:hypothetical protein